MKKIFKALTIAILGAMTLGVASCSNNSSNNASKSPQTGDISMFFMALILISSLVGSLYLYKKNLVDLKK